MNTTKNYLWLLSIPISLLFAYLYYDPIVSELQEEIHSRPPVIVFDMARLTLDSLPVGSDSAVISEHFKRVQGAINKFSSAGFVVLSRQHIISAPDSLLVTKDDIYPELVSE